MPESVVDKQDDKDERPSADSNSMTKEHKEARQQDRKQKEKQKNYADKSKLGDRVLADQYHSEWPPPHTTQKHMWRTSEEQISQPGGERR